MNQAETLYKYSEGTGELWMQTKKLKKYVVKVCKVVMTIYFVAIVGHKPILKIGQSFEYVSYCPLPTPDGRYSSHLYVVANMKKHGWELYSIKSFYRTRI